MQVNRDDGDSIPPPESRVRFWADAVLAMAPAVMLAMSVTLVIPVLPAVSAHLGGGQNAKLLAQYFVAIAGLGVMLGAPLGGFIVDRAGLRPVLVASALLYALSGMAGAVLDGAPALLASRWGMGFGAGAFAAAATVLVGHRWHGTSRAGLLGYRGAAGAAGGVVTLLIAGAAGDAFGWRAPFLLYGLALPLAPLALVATNRRPTSHAPRLTGSPPEWRPLLPIYLRSLPLYIVMFTTTTQLPLLLAEVGVAQARQRSLILATSTVCGGAAALAFGRLRGALPPRKLLLFIVLLYGLGVSAMGLMNGPIVAIVGGLLCGAATGLTPAYFDHEVLGESTARIRGRAVAVLVTVHYLGQFLNPVVLGMLGAVIGMRPALLIAGLALLAWVIASTPAALRRKPVSDAPLA